MTFSFAIPRIKSSAAAMCSITWATDQRSGAGLKFHCASDSPFVASRTFFFVVSRYCSALSFSACVTSCADAVVAPAITSNAINTPARDFVLIFLPSLFLSWCRETGTASIADLASLRRCSFLDFLLSQTLLPCGHVAVVSPLPQGADNLLAFFYRLDPAGANRLKDQR